MGEPSTGEGEARSPDAFESSRALIAAEALCAARGERLNDPGRRVLKALLASGAPLKAYDLMHALASGGRSAAPPTVYRALKFLIGMGLAHRIESLNAFVACRFPGEAHLPGFRVCESCGAAEEFRLDQVPPEVGGHGEWRLVFEVLAPCPSCAGATSEGA